MSIIFSTKAGTLNALQGILQSARVAPLVYFSVEDWTVNRTECINKIEQNLIATSWIVRSSCQSEDSIKSSQAGAYLSLLNINAIDLELAIEQVIGSFGKSKPKDQVLIQPMLSNVIRSGVAFSHDPNTCAPYRVVNWVEGGNTEAVTGGKSSRVWQQAALSSKRPPELLVPIINLLEELINLFNEIPVDCEFAVTQEGGNEQLWLLQARPLVMPSQYEKNLFQKQELEVIEKKIARGMRTHQLVVGQRTVYGVMPDWNPAEIIGIRPKPLALSLYRDLITDAIWAYQRNNYGYRNLRSLPLMQHFFGLPYIDVRLSFNSFIPAELDTVLAGRLVDYYIDRLLQEPSLHDKIEFEIVFSCYTLDLSERLEKLKSAGFSKREINQISESLKKITNRILHPKNGLWKVDASKIKTLSERREALLTSNADQLERIYWLIEDSKRYGTLPFAGLARAAFVAVQMLKSLVAKKIFTETEFHEFLGSISTVSSKISEDKGTLDRPTFLSKYGHLRPGTYDILSPRYDEAPEIYFDWSQPKRAQIPVKPFALTLDQMLKIGELLEEDGIETDPVGLLNFMKKAIELRELSKFHFTHNLSDAITLIQVVGEEYGFTHEDLSYSDISVFKELHIAAANSKDALFKSIEQGKKIYESTKRISLPPLIVSPQDVWGFELPESSPNYITQKQVTAPVKICNLGEQLSGCIVCIESADPGYDWLFSHNIAGLITSWGGVNSHMAIRAGELGLPAVIGAGELLYRRWSTAKRLHLDCAGRRIEVFS